MSKKRRKKPRKMALSPVSLGATVKENLPLPTVYYPNHYGTFFAFARDETSPVVLCACSESAVENYIRLRSMRSPGRNANPLREAPLESLYFPDIVAELSLSHQWDPWSAIRFEKALCHRCNLVAPTLHYCHEMYGTRFIQRFGWYVNQAYFRLGIMPMWLDFLPDVCPKDFQDFITRARGENLASQREVQRLMDIASGPPRDDITDDEPTYWRNVRDEDAQDMVSLRRSAAQATRVVTKKVENIVREEFGFRKVGESWVSETLLYQIVRQIFQGHEIVRHHRPDWLEGLELDILLPAEQLAFEYQGQQHYHPVKAWGGQNALEELQARDARKADICEQLGIELVTVDYTEPLTEDHIRKVLLERRAGATAE